VNKGVSCTKSNVSQSKDDENKGRSYIPIKAWPLSLPCKTHFLGFLGAEGLSGGPMTGFGGGAGGRGGPKTGLGRGPRPVVS